MIRIDQKPDSRRAGLSPAAYCAHCILTSPSAKKRGVSGAQEHVLRSCARVFGADDLRELRKLGHGQALERHLRVQAEIAEADAASAAYAAELERRKEQAREAVAEYMAGEGA